jgi:hypothetical protein
MILLKQIVKITFITTLHYTTPHYTTPCETVICDSDGVTGIHIALVGGVLISSLNY